MRAGQCDVMSRRERVQLPELVRKATVDLFWIVASTGNSKIGGLQCCQIGGRLVRRLGAARLGGETNLQSVTRHSETLCYDGWRGTVGGFNDSSNV